MRRPAGRGYFLLLTLDQEKKSESGGGGGQGSIKHYTQLALKWNRQDVNGVAGLVFRTSGHEGLYILVSFVKTESSAGKFG